MDSESRPPRGAVQKRAAADSAAIAAQLQSALESRVVIEQAKGVVSHYGRLDMDDSFAVLRRYARDHNIRLTELAHAVVARALNAQDLLQHAVDKGAVRPQT